MAHPLTKHIQYLTAIVNEIGAVPGAFINQLQT